MRGAKIALALAGLAAGILLCEGLLALFHPQIHQRPRVWQYDPDLGWSHIPGAGGRMITPEFDVEMRINGDGLRDRDYERTKAPGTRRLLVFGDSFAEGWGVRADAAVSARLETCLRARGEQIEVINFGVAGYGTDQELLLFEKAGRHYQPDLVLVFFYANDLWNNAADRGIGAERGYKPFFRAGADGRLVLAGVPVRRTAFWDQGQERQGPWHRRLEGYLSKHWHFYVLLDKALRPEIEPRQQQAFYRGLYGADPEGRYDPAWELSGRILHAFAERVERQGAEMVLVYVPSIVQIEEENWRTKRQLHGLVGEYDLLKPNERLAVFARDHGFRLIDLYPSFKEAARERTLYFRDSHWNEQGHALAAQELCAALAAGEGEK